ncbi:MAG: ATP synthase F1 subunit delta [Candidatus Delongbacteria bacterium]|nr:MAG: ATP synthase F1 subunit delta [Candidatus Delongbacteria bacterium]
MKNQKLIRKYTEAIFEIAREKGCIDSFKEDLKSISDAFSVSKDLNKVFGDSKISPAQKKEIFRGIFENKISKDCLSLGFIIFDKGRESILDLLYQDYVALVDEKEGVIEALITLAYDVDDSIKERILSYISSLGYSKIRSKYVVDNSLILGFTILIEDRILDNSFKGNLKELRTILEM